MRSNLDTLAARLPSEIVCRDPATIAPRLREWRDRFVGATTLLLRPRSATEVSDILSNCNALAVGVVPQGGNTGLCGGAIPSADGEQVLLSLERMNRIRNLDAMQCTLAADAGCVLADLQTAAEDQGRLLGISLASEGSCQLGGNLSTNAGGIHVIRYGSTRDQVLGLEVVLADGRVLDGMRALRKDNTGYDLKQIFVGAEGTLGVITGAVMRLHPQPNHLQTLCLAVDAPGIALTVLDYLTRSAQVAVHALELMPAVGVDMAVRHIPQCRAPLDGAADWFVLAQLELEDAALTGVAAGLLGLEGVVDGVAAASEQQAAQLWHLRESFSAAQKAEGASLKHDLAVPLAAIPKLIADGSARIQALCADARVVAFGHVGDGNIHFNVSQPRGNAEALYHAAPAIGEALYDLVDELAGSFSAEHGIGQLKVDLLSQYRSEVELDLMRRLKDSFDPKGILNPGKVLPAVNGCLDPAAPG
jgi:FAD/FMN-containing dehydrogenase